MSNCVNENKLNSQTADRTSNELELELSEVVDDEDDDMAELSCNSEHVQWMSEFKFKFESVTISPCSRLYTCKLILRLAP